MDPSMFSPEMMRFAAEKMKEMTPEDMRRMQEQMARLSPDEIAAMTRQASQHANASADYAFRGSEQLKTEGNNLHNLGRYADAVPKYLKAKKNCEGMSDPRFQALAKSCSLNLASCYLKMGAHAKAARECDEVLASDRSNLKALFRRGQAHMHLGQLQGARDDLRAALALSPGDDTVAAMLAQVEKKITESPSTSEPAASDSSSTTAGGANDRIREGPPSSMTSSSTTRQGPTPASAPSAAYGFPGDPSWDVQAAAKEVKAAVERDPDIIKSTTAMMASMSDEQIAAMSGGKMDASMARQAAEMMKNMAPEDMARMMDMAASMQASGAFPGMTAGSTSAYNTNSSSNYNNTSSNSSRAAASAAPSAAKEPSKASASASRVTSSSTSASTATTGSTGADASGGASATARDGQGGAAVPSAASSSRAGGGAMPVIPPGFKPDPDMIRTTTAMMANMSDEQIAAMSGGKMNASMARQAAEMMKNMSPEEVNRMMEMAASMQAAGVVPPGFPGAMPPSGSGGGSSSSSVMPATSSVGKAAMPSPEQLRSSTAMMANMTDEQIAAMSGGKMDAGMARQAAEMMKNMSPEDMARMMEMATSMQASGGFAGLGADGSGMPNLSPDMLHKDPNMIKNLS
eukprot:jgi/Mesvir1/18864/Mv10516-RA.1